MKKIRFNYQGKQIILDQAQVEQIVCEWYTNGMIPDILQNEDGLDLEEVLYFLEDGYNINVQTVKELEELQN